MEPATLQFNLPQRVVFGSGSADRIAGELTAIGERVFVCSDPGIAGAGLLTDVTSALEAAGMSVDCFTETSPEFTSDDVDIPTEQALRMPGGPDIVLGLGGGTCMDMAKLVAARITHRDLPIRDMVAAASVPGPVVPIVAVPTTAGTGSEVTPIAVMGHPDTHVKMGLSSRYLVPTLAVVDPRLTDGCPPSVTADSGMDALAHAIEAFTARRRDPGTEPQGGFVGKNPLSDILALEAMRRIGEHLRTAVDAPTAEARNEMALASLYAGMSFAQAGTGLAHALQYPIGHLTGTTHGLGVGLLLPYAMWHNLPDRESELATVAIALGASPGDSDPVTLARMAIAAVQRLGQDVGLPASLEEIGLDVDDLSGVCNAALGIARLIENNGSTVTRESIERVAAAAFAGNLEDDQPGPTS